LGRKTIERRVVCWVLGLAAVGDPAARAWAAPDAAAKPTLVLVVQDAQGRDLPNVRVTMDGAPLVERIDGRPVSVDPGEHHLLFRAEGMNPIETTVVARDGQHKLRVLVFLTATGVPHDPSAELPAAEPPATISPWRRRVAGALVGASAASLVVGTVWALWAKAEYDHALTTECGGSASSCSPQGIADGHTAHDRAFVATLAFAGAGVFLAGAATVYWKWPSTQDRIAIAPTVSGRGAGVTLSW
jgi:hypothetical protein